jgi:predicted nucleic acid-binding Zn ribbon protein
MNNEVVLNEVKSNNNNSIALVTKSVINSHCIVCNSLFTNKRIGKLYCSNKCKQYRFNHKQQLQEQMPVLIEVSEFTA